MAERVIDTHVHVWDFDQAEYTWLKGDTSILNRSYDLEELEPDRVAAGIMEGILVQAANNPEDTDWMLRVAADHDWIKGVVGWLPLQDPAATAGILEKGYATSRYFKGVRHLIHNEADPGWLFQEPVLESLRLLARYDLPYDVVGIIPAHIRTVLEVMEKVPELRLVFDHLNQPPILSKERFGQWGELMQAAAGHPGCYVKISGLGTASGNFQGWKAVDLEPYIGFALQYFGEDRCLFGGDWPVSLLAGSYQRTWKTYRDLLRDLLEEEGREKVLYKNAERFYKLPAASDKPQVAKKTAI